MTFLHASTVPADHVDRTYLVRDMVLLAIPDGTPNADALRRTVFDATVDLVRDVHESLARLAEKTQLGSPGGPGNQAPYAAGSTKTAEAIAKSIRTIGAVHWRRYDDEGGEGR
jgi:hypothetical protein